MFKRPKFNKLKNPPLFRKISYPPRNIKLPNTISEKELKAAFECEVKIFRDSEIDNQVKGDFSSVKKWHVTPTPTLSHGKCQVKLCHFCYENYSIMPLTKKLTDLILSKINLTISTTSLDIPLGICKSCFRNVHREHKDLLIKKQTNAREKFGPVGNINESEICNCKICTVAQTSYTPKSQTVNSRQET